MQTVCDQIERVVPAPPLDKERVKAQTEKNEKRKVRAANPKLAASKKMCKDILTKVMAKNTEQLQPQPAGGPQLTRLQKGTTPPPQQPGIPICHELESPKAAAAYM